MFKQMFLFFITFIPALFGFPAMIVDLTFDASTIKKYGGQRFSYKRVKATGADLDVPDTWHDGFYREKDSMDFSQPLEPVTDCSGQQVASDYGIMDMKYILTSLQSDANTETFIKDEVEANYFAVLQDAGKGAGALDKARFFPITKWAKVFKEDSPGRRPEITIVPSQNASAVTPASIPAWATAKGFVFGDFLCAASGYYVVTEK